MGYELRKWPLWFELLLIYERNKTGAGTKYRIQAYIATLKG